MQYVLKPTEDDILHFGKGHDDNPPGRGSGRYAWGTGKNPGNKKVKKGLFSRKSKEKSSNNENKIETDDATGISEKTKDDLTRRWDYKKEPFDDYIKRHTNAYKEYSKSFSDQTKNFEKELEDAVSDIVPNDASDSYGNKYCGISGLLSNYYDKNNLEDTVSMMWFYKYEDGDQGVDNSAISQLVYEHGYDNAKNKIDKYYKAMGNLEESMAKDFDNDTAHELISARTNIDDTDSNYFTYRVRDGEIASSKSDYDNAIKKAELLNDFVTSNYIIEDVANKVANKLQADRKSGLSDKEITDKYAISNEFMEDVFRRSNMTHGINMGTYIIKPTQDDIFHSAKGTTWKTHKYVDIVTKNGKKYYKYGRYLASRAKSKITGNAVTNKDGRKSGNSSRYQYSPNIKTNRDGTMTEPQRHLQGRYMANTTGYGGKLTNNMSVSRNPIAITNKDGTPYNPTIKTIKPQNDISGRTSVIKNGYFETLNKALVENMTAETKVDGLALFGNIMSAHRGTSISNRTLEVKPYTPTYKTSPTPYSPPQSTKAASSNPTSYSPTYKTSPTPYTPTYNYTPTKTTEKSSSSSAPRRLTPSMAMGRYEPSKATGGGHDFAVKSDVEKKAIATVNSIIDNYKADQERKKAEKEREKEEKAKQREKEWGGDGSSSILGTTNSLRVKYNKSKGGKHYF